MKTAAIALGIFALLFGVALIPAIPLAYRATQSLGVARAAAADAERALIKERNFVLAAEYLHVSATRFRMAQQNLAYLQYLRPIPWVGRQLKAARTAVQAAQLSTSSLATVSENAGKIWTLLQSYTTLRVGELSEAQRSQLLSAILQELPGLRAAAKDLGHAQVLLQGLDDFDLARPLQKAVDELMGRTAWTQGLLADVLPILNVAPDILGYPAPKTYLFILQNSDELRPTGGFIGTIGLLSLDTGHLANFFTDDVYNLDRLVPPQKRPPAPAPLAKFIEQPRWFLRDANWDPDFPTSARRVLQFYKEERISGGKASGVPEALPPDINGVIAIMPETIASLLKIVGPLTVEGQTFDAENLTDALEFEVEVRFAQQGIPRAQRKAIIAKLGHELIAKILALPAARFPEVIHALRSALDEKHLLIFHADSKIQSELEAAGWAGQIKSAPGDYLAVFDANLFSLKTDPYVPRTIFYRVSAEEHALVGEVEIVYTYPQAGPAWKTKGYRSWTRVYVPSGSILISASGAMEDENSTRPGRVAITQEFGKTVFGAFIAVQVGEVKRLRLQYRLPEKLRELVQAGQYELLVQKQPGTAGHGLTITADFGKLPKQWSPTGLPATKEETKLTWQTSLRRDQRFTIEF